MEFTTNNDIEPVQFWIEAEESYPNLALIAVDILVAPASTAPVEHMFSTAGVQPREKETDSPTIILREFF